MGLEVAGHKEAAGRTGMEPLKNPRAFPGKSLFLQIQLALRGNPCSPGVAISEKVRSNFSLESK